MIESNRNWLHLVELIEYRAHHQPNQVVFSYIINNLDEFKQLTYGELYQKSRAIAATLKQNCAKGQRALLLYPSGLEFISAFFGCLIAGVIAVPTFPPTSPSSTEKFESIYADSKPTCILTTHETITHMQRAQSTKWSANYPNFSSFDFCGKHCFTTERIRLADSYDETNINILDIALLQYSSGSTGQPKGIMLSHKNLMANIRLINKSYGLPEHLKNVCWLPHCHDMGLIGNILQPIFSNMQTWLMAPSLFVRNPFLWLECISTHKLNFTSAPNFAFRICNQKLSDQQIQTLDLSNLHYIVIGSEPLHAQTLIQFISKMKPTGLKADALWPSYGLAEATLMVTMRKGIATHEKCLSGMTQIQVSCGKPQQELKIVDPTTKKECTDGNIGEIWLRSDSVAQGYWRKEDLTKQAFHANLINEPNHTFFRSGDLGYISNGELFVTGRMKDLMIIAGVNHYAQDIEKTVAFAHPQLQHKQSIAFSVLNPLNGCEAMVLFVEVPLKIKSQADILSEIEVSIKKDILSKHQLKVNKLFFTAKKLPRTTSGKPRRMYCKQCYEQNQLEAVLGNAYNESLII